MAHRRGPCWRSWSRAPVATNRRFHSPLPRVSLDPALIGAWRCLSAEPDDAESATIIIGLARERVYAVTFQESGKDPDRYEAHGSVLRGSTLLSIRELGKTSGKPWVFGRYVLLRPNILHIQIVSDEALKGVDASPAQVRRAIERRLGDPRLFVDFCTCVRAKAGKS